MKRFKYMALAALVAFAACDEGNDTIVTPDVTGDITGVVTIEGAAVAGVSVALSSGQTTTTDGSGAYTFAGVAAGAYTISISGYAADATFSSTSKAATIVSTGQVATVNFDGAYVRTSAILGNVSAGGSGLSGVSVSIGSSTTQTDANGQYAFSGLRSGTYTVTVSGFDAQHYAFATSSQNVTIGVGESKVISFNGQLLATATISGTLYVDGNSNLTKDAGEPAVAKAGITVALERAVGDSLYTTTDANGQYSFTDLEEGTYKVILLDQATMPGAFTRSGDERYLAVATSGGATTVNFPFRVTTQYVNVYGMLGRDARNVGVAPIKNWTITLYPTEVDATAGTNAITTGVKTSATGLSTFKFLRTKDYSPNAATIDGIVFAKVGAAPAGYATNGETVIEIPWLPMDSMVMAPDTFDATFGSAVVKVRAQEIDGDSLPGWTAEVRIGADTTAAKIGSITANAKGNAYYTLTAPTGIGADTFPVIGYFALNATQPATHPWTQTPSGAMTRGSFLKVSWDGTVLAADTINAGAESVKYSTVDVMVQVHRELDDTLGYTAGDGLSLPASGVTVNLRRETSSGTTSVGTLSALAGVGTVTFSNVDVTKTYQLRARTTGNYDVLNDTSFTVTFDGSDETVITNHIGGSGGRTSSFMVKRNNNTINGRVKTREGASPVAGLVVTVTPTSMNIQGTAAKVDTTDGTGAWQIDDLRDGPYTATISAGDSAYVFLRTLKTTKVPAASAIVSGNVNNTSPTAGTRDLFAGPTPGVEVVNFEAFRNDVKFSGLVVNDRDTDLTTVDPGEALAGAIINLYRDDDGSATAGTDTLTASATTDANGAYAFTGLVEGRYTAVWSQNTPSTDVQVLTKLTTTGTATTKVSATPIFGANVAHVGNLPAWNYADASTPSNITPANFTFVYSNTVVQGFVLKQAAGNAAVPGMTVQLQKCYQVNLAGTTLTTVSGPRPDVGNNKCTAYLPGVLTTQTDAAGKFSFTGLREGVYRVVPLVGTVVPAYANFVGVATGFAASPGANDNEAGLFLTSGSGDIETLTFHVY